ncbi:MAG: hypothetical protein KKB51_23715 [Candidatus Riflebacteria bacterium]|nr:hypothetical protein [Candidatus Riflebacteria bacterium]
MMTEEFRALVENLCKKINDGEKAQVCKEVMQPIFDRIKSDCYQEFLSSCENNYQNIDNSADLVLRSKVKVVEIFETALNNDIRTGKDANEQRSKEAKRGNN